jgi:hypothetical protein
MGGSHRDPSGRDLGEALGLMLSSQRVNELIQPTLQYLPEFIESEIDAVIRNSALGKVVCTDALRPISRPNKIASTLCRLSLLPGYLSILQSRTQQGQCARAVLML